MIEQIENWLALYQLSQMDLFAWYILICTNCELYLFSVGHDK